MDDGVAYVRALAGQFQESAVRFGSSFRRWSDSTESGRSLWDDAAGRDVYARFVDPHFALLSEAEPALALAVETQQAALAAATEAAGAAAQAATLVAQAAGAMRSALGYAATARTEAASAQSELSRARSMAQAVMATVSALGE